MTKKRIYKNGILILFALCAPLAFSAEKSTEALQSITKQISVVQKTIQTYLAKKQFIQSSLKHTEIQIGALSKTISKKQSEIKEQKKKLSLTNDQYNQLNQTLAQQKKLLSEQIRSAYMFGQQPYLKILLNQENPEQLARFLEYYRYFNLARIAAIQSAQETAEKIKQAAASIQQQTEKLSSTKNELSTKQVSLNQEQKKRQLVLQTTTQQIQSTQKQLEILIANKNHLENVIQEINLQQQYGYAPGASFLQMKGKLHWPVNSRKIAQYFHENIAEGRLQSTGIVIDDKMGAPVSAIFSGKVVFADWLNGFGLLTIIQHGDYLTLYARNQSLYVKAGDIVRPGQLIATVGDSGGYHSPALYFEIRQKNIPLNPKIWLASG
jgi:septal ring factor EnvC (AmiA/AmiB activator)